jgi:hypothetical protein
MAVEALVKELSVEEIESIRAQMRSAKVAIDAYLDFSRTEKETPKQFQTSVGIINGKINDPNTYSAVRLFLMKGLELKDKADDAALLASIRILLEKNKMQHMAASYAPPKLPELCSPRRSWSPRKGTENSPRSRSESDSPRAMDISSSDSESSESSSNKSNSPRPSLTQQLWDKVSRPFKK